MQKKSILISILLLMVFLFGLAFSASMGYAYWENLTNEQDPGATVGDWGTPISTAQEFYDFAMKTTSVSTDRYFLLNDIDFTGFTWSYTSTNNAATFRGFLDGNGKTIRNLTLYMNSSSYSYLGIFPRMQGGSVYNLTLENVYLSLGSTALGGTALRSGLITGNAYGLTNTISGLTILNCGVRGTSTAGTGGLIGNVTTATTVVLIENIKATGLKVFTKSSSAGGLVGYVATSGAQITVNDVDLQGEVYAYASSSYTGGIIGQIISGAKLTLHRAIVEMTSRNTLETNATYYNMYSARYLGGLVGYSLSVSANVTLTDAFFTGSLFPSTNTRRADIGTATGRFSATTTKPTLTNVFYSQVQFRSSTGTVVYTPSGTPTGQMSTLVNASTMPSVAWWTTFSTSFLAANDWWALDETTGRLALIR